MFSLSLGAEEAERLASGAGDARLGQPEVPPARLQEVRMVSMCISQYLL